MGSPLRSDYEQSLLLIIESDLSSRFPYAEEVLCKHKRVLPLKNITKRNTVATLIARLMLRQKVFAAYEELRKDLYKYRYIFLSNAEGFIANNIIRWIRRDFPNVMLLHLQHGMFVLEGKSRIKSLGALLNKITEATIDYNVAGGGFVNRHVDFYIIYNNYYRSLLINEGVSRGKIVVSTLLLKGKTFLRSENAYSQNKGNVLFLLQCLSALAITDEETEAKLISCSVNWLSRQYEYVFLKQHPYCDIKLSKVPSNCEFVEGNVQDIAKKCGTAVSFFSEALFECEFLGLRTIAIRAKDINIMPGIYHLFETVGDIQEDDSVVLSENSRSFSRYYESELTSADDLFQLIAEC